MNLSKEIAKDLLSINAITLSPNKPYTWASGLRSPIYCDNRLTISHPIIRKRITQGFTELIKAQYPEVDAIVGTATAGIPQACWVADALDLPTAYVRSSSKEHGKTNLIEGDLKENIKVIIIEDLISTGSSSIKACVALEDQNIEVLAVLSVFDYQLKSSKTNFDNAKIKYNSLCDFSTLVEVAEETLKETDIELLKQWMNDPLEYDQNFKK